jgi:hypothetical protein
VVISQTEVRKAGLTETLHITKEYATLTPKAFKRGVVLGINKAMELNKDKVFTIEDCKKLMKSASYGWFEKDFDKHIQSLQQPTEIEVEIEMQCCGNYSPPCNINCEYGGKPKLDSEG